MSELVIKSLQENFQDLDDATGIIKGYANVYNIKDSHGDISMQGSFVKSVSENKDWIRINKNHDKNLFIGVPVELDPYDTYGLGLTAKLLMDTQKGKDAFYEAKFLVDNGFKAGFSIEGWITKRGKTNKSNVEEYKLGGVALLTVEPSNQLSYVEMFKSLKEDGAQSADEFFKMVEKAYNEHNFSDSYLTSLELTLKSLTKEPNDETDETTPKVEPTDLITNIYSNFIQI